MPRLDDYMAAEARDHEAHHAELERWHTFFHDPDAAVDTLEGLRDEVRTLLAVLEAVVDWDEGRINPVLRESVFDDVHAVLDKHR